MFDKGGLLMARGDGRCFRVVLIGDAIRVLFAPLVRAQTIDLGDAVARPIPGVGHDYVRGLSDTVNPANGNLFIKIDLPVQPFIMPHQPQRAIIVSQKSSRAQK